MGPATAQSIIGNRPYTAIEQVSRASGIGEPGSKSYEDIKHLITVGDTPPAEQLLATSTEPQATSVSVSAGNAPPPITVHLRIPDSVVVGAGSYFEAEAYGTKGEALTQGVRYLWSFGDGGSAEGKRVFHAYAYPGRHVVQVTAAYYYSSGSARATLEALAGALSATAETDGSLLLFNRSDRDIDIGGWSFVQAGQRFLVPEGTYVLAGEGVRFAPGILGFFAQVGAAVHYPNGVAALSAAPAGDSPLRGQRVAAPRPVAAPLSERPVLVDPGAPALPADEPSAIEASQLQSAVGATDGSLAFWVSLLAGVGVVGVGAGSAYVLQKSRREPETSPEEEEFEIE